MIANTNPPTTGMHILNCRPTSQAAALTNALLQHGHVVTEFPCIEIQPTNATRPAHKADGIIVTSINTLHRGAGSGEWGTETHTCFISIGPSTQEALLKQSIKSIVPSVYSSEGILAMPETQNITGQHWVILTSKNGKPLLKQTLQQRGAAVTVVEAYERLLPTHDEAECTAIRNQPYTAIVCTSLETLLNCEKLLGAEKLASQPIIIVSDAMQQHCHRQQYNGIRANNATPQAIVNAIQGLA